MTQCINLIYIRDFCILYRRISSLSLYDFEPFLDDIYKFLTTDIKKNPIVFCSFNIHLIKYLEKPQEFFLFSGKDYENIICFLEFFEQFAESLIQNIKVYKSDKEIEPHNFHLIGSLYQELSRFLQINREGQRLLKKFQRQLENLSQIVTFSQNTEINRLLKTIAQEHTNMSNILIKAVYFDLSRTCPEQLNGSDYEIFPFVERVGCPREGSLSNQWKDWKSETFFFDRDHERFCIFSKRDDIFRIPRLKPIPKINRCSCHVFLFYIIQTQDRFYLSKTPKNCFMVVVENRDLMEIRRTREIFLEGVVQLSGGLLGFLGRA